MFAIGFTGTSSGMTPAQREAFRRQIQTFAFDEFHHGDCVGADKEAHEEVRRWCPSVRIVIHPPVDDAHRAHCDGDELREPKTHFARNRAIVAESNLVIGVSVAPKRLDRGGTWYTLDHANRQPRVTVHVIWPDGTVTPHPDDVR